MELAIYSRGSRSRRAICYLLRDFATSFELVGPRGVDDAVLTFGRRNTRAPGEPPPSRASRCARRDGHRSVALSEVRVGERTGQVNGDAPRPIYGRSAEDLLPTGERHSASSAREPALSETFAASSRLGPSKSLPAASASAHVVGALRGPGPHVGVAPHDRQSRNRRAGDSQR